MSRYSTRCGALALALALGSGGFAAPARADTARPVQRSALTTVSASTLATLHTARPAQSRRQQTGTASAPGFFKTRKGAVAIGLMAAGAGFTFWSINHDRKPVKSPIR